MSARAWALFTTMCVVWGVPYLLIKVAVDADVPPAFVAWARIVLGAVVLLALARRAGTLRLLRGRRLWGWLAAFAVLETAVPFPMLAVGEQHVASSLAAILIASAPLLVALLALRFDHAERVTGVRLAGLVVGLGGVVALMGIDVGGRHDELLGAGAIMVAAIGYAFGALILKRHLADLDARATMGASLAIAALLLTPLAAIDPPAAMPPARGVFALVALGLVCTALAFVVYSRLIAEIGPSRALVFTYINPVVAVALGVVILGEGVGLGAAIGLVLILAGSWVSTGGRLPLGAAARRARGWAP